MIVAVAALLAGSEAADDFSAPLISIPVTPDLAISRNATAEVRLPPLSRHIMLKADGCGTSAVVYFDLSGKRHLPTDSKTYNLRLLQGERFEAFYQVLTIGVSPASAATGATSATCSWTLQAGR
mgnify:CR=1 FL=1